MEAAEPTRSAQNLLAVHPADTAAVLRHTAEQDVSQASEHAQEETAQSKVDFFLGELDGTDRMIHDNITRRKRKSWLLA